MVKKVDTTIFSVSPDSYANDAGLVPGDKILKINGHEFYDILEYRYLTAEYEVVLEVLKANGDIEEITIENNYEDLGIEFSSALIDKEKSCRNKCIFCFIDQLPKGMRETVYFKDDDTRLSFLQGNYVTLTNMDDEEIDRLIKMRVSPINISVHTTNPDLRVLMLKNKNASKIYEIMKKFSDNNISMNCQIVLCKGYNDKDELDRTLNDLANLYPAVESVSVVPVGLTAFREGLCQLEAFNAKDSYEVINQINEWQEELLEELGTRFVYLSDEFYINAKLPIPKADEYEGFPQIENGVGLLSSLLDEFGTAIEHLNKKNVKRTVSVVTGTLVFEHINDLCKKLEMEVSGLKVNVYKVKNEFFGGGVNVSGLIVGQDIINQLSGCELGEEVFISSSMLKADEDIFLDDVTLSELSQKLGANVVPVDNDGFDFVEKITGLSVEF